MFRVIFVGKAFIFEKSQPGLLRSFPDFFWYVRKQVNVYLAFIIKPIKSIPMTDEPVSLFSLATMHAGVLTEGAKTFTAICLHTRLLDHQLAQPWLQIFSSPILESILFCVF